MPIINSLFSNTKLSRACQYKNKFSLLMGQGHTHLKFKVKCYDGQGHTYLKCKVMLRFCQYKIKYNSLMGQIHKKSSSSKVQNHKYLISDAT